MRKSTTKNFLKNEEGNFIIIAGVRLQKFTSLIDMGLQS